MQFSHFNLGLGQGFQSFDLEALDRFQVSSNNSNQSANFKVARKESGLAIGISDFLKSLIFLVMMKSALTCFAAAYWTVSSKSLKSGLRANNRVDLSTGAISKTDSKSLTHSSANFLSFTFLMR